MARSNKSDGSPNAKRPLKPGFLVIFEQGAKPATVLRAATKSFAKMPAAQEDKDTGVQCIRKRTASSAAQLVYPEFQIAAVDLSKVDADSLGKHSDVLAVVENEPRSILGNFHPEDFPMQPLGDPDRRDWPWDDPGPRVWPWGEVDRRKWPWSTMPSADGGYVRGWRDAMIAFHEFYSQNGAAFALGGKGSGDMVGDSAGLCAPLRLLGMPERGSKWTGKGVRVAVLDSGVDMRHPDLQQALSPKLVENFVQPGTPVVDRIGHGTHCCGIIAGAAEPKVGPRYGVAPDVQLLVGKVIGDDGIGYDSDILSGILWAATQGARIISLSLGSPRKTGENWSIAYQRVAEYLAYKKQDVLLVAAAGNSSNRSSGMVLPLSNPAACPSFMAVAACDNSGTVADFSSGQTDEVGLVDMSAPGVGIKSSVPGKKLYGRMTGTSCAAPHVAGVAALYLQKYQDYTSLDLWDHMERSARPRGSTADLGRGVVTVPS
ncbi:S8 family serine peptidase [Roseimicrobium sp. ORNL1]|uniref:S8 family serine peptidase n=1 Tax=Roseimicrobium sp. ORNL1 TaxID=2711231 RepID=UPI0013E1C836|nr:S8 family serine peptidase [Roseimicrobium sp. ORNL1]QIF02061.1 S8 family serine peptidase [Roseimicrobium sp. ORNL1]